MASKIELAARLDPETRKVFLARCAQIEKELTTACGHSGDTCLESGCSLEGDEDPCLQPVLRAGADYDAACERVYADLVGQRAN